MAQRNLQFVGRIQSGEENFDLDIRDLDLSLGDQGLRLHASTGLNGGVSSYALSGSGASLVATCGHRSATLASGQATLLEGGDALIAAGAAITGVSRHGLTGAGAAGSGANLALPGLTAPVALVAATQLATGQDLLVTLDQTGGLDSWRIGANGATATPGPQLSLPQAAALAVTDTGVLLVADAELGGLASYRIDQSTGALSAAARLGTDDGLPVAGPSALEVISAHGQTWAILGAGQSGSLTVLEVTAGGRLSMTDHLSDTLSSRFGQLCALEVVEVEGRVLVLAGGGDGGLSLLELLPDGRLLHRAALENGVGQDLASISALAAVQIGASLEIYAASQDGAGLARLRYDLGDLAPAGRLGSAGDDLLLGAARLSGGGGEDVLLAAAGGAVLSGGAGADVFVPVDLDRPERTVIRITDFTAGEDHIDMSAFTGLRSLAGITTRARADGIELSCDGTTILVQSHNGRALELEDLWPTGLGMPHRWLLGESDEDGIRYGGGGRDRLTGDQGAEILDGQGGADVLSGGGGNDSLRGGDGNDQLDGDSGDDQLDGGRDDDLLRGGDGRDRLTGDQGDDRLEGGGGEDRLDGGAGDDLLLGGSGDDLLFGGSGLDRLTGGSGNDTLSDSDGDAILLGGGGNDRLRSGNGADRLTGGGGNDRLTSGDGEDLLKGGGGGDVLLGGAGADRLDGGKGGDRLIAGSGADRLEGGKGEDLLKGGGGADVFVFARGHGADTIRGFRPDEDQIDLGALRGGYDDLEISRAGPATVIDTGAGEIWLAGLRPGQIDADDFLF